jgi:hypothetical protein
VLVLIETPSLEAGAVRKMSGLNAVAFSLIGMEARFERI